MQNVENVVLDLPASDGKFQSLLSLLDNHLLEEDPSHLVQQLCRVYYQKLTLIFRLVQIDNLCNWKIKWLKMVVKWPFVILLFYASEFILYSAAFSICAFWTNLMILYHQTMEREFS